MEIAGNKTLKNVVKQTSVKIATTNCSCILYDKEQPNMTYATFCKLARDKDSKFEGRSFEQLQTLFWEELHKNETLYGMDNEFSLFPDDSKWNLNKLTQSESLIHRVRFYYLFVYSVGDNNCTLDFLYPQTCVCWENQPNLFGNVVFQLLWRTLYN